jgi:hypothetical protein
MVPFKKVAVAENCDKKKEIPKKFPVIPGS